MRAQTESPLGEGLADMSGIRAHESTSPTIGLSAEARARLRDLEDQLRRQLRERAAGLARGESPDASPTEVTERHLLAALASLHAEAPGHARHWSSLLTALGSAFVGAAVALACSMPLISGGHGAGALAIAAGGLGVVAAAAGLRLGR